MPSSATSPNLSPVTLPTPSHGAANHSAPSHAAASVSAAGAAFACLPGDREPSEFEALMGEPAPFIDRRRSPQPAADGERRQFASSHHGLSPEARELALAIDQYKLEHRRRYVTFEEMLQVINGLGYQK